MLAASLASSSSSSSNSNSNNNKRQRGGGGGGSHQPQHLSASASASILFDVAVVDEASQIAEPLAAVSLAAGGASYVVVAGDPQQLPPVVASPSAVSLSSSSSSTLGNNNPPPVHGLSRSLLSRLIAAGHGARLLRTQYRCHPAIAAVANSHFYANRLIDGVTAEQRAPLVPWLPPLSLVDVRSGAAEEYNGSNGSGSVSNRAEAAAVVRLVSRLRAAGVRPGSVGVICFFRAQVEVVRRLLLENRMQQQNQNRQQERPAAEVEKKEEEKQEEENDEEEEEEEESAENDDEDEIPTVATVDSYQGCEKDVIIVTTAATRPSAFTRDTHRVNVAVTRARRHLVVVGHGGALVAAGGGSGGGRNANALGAIVRACSSTPGAVLEMV
jgi:superfamily I DNA and/or RNA helicase